MLLSRRSFLYTSAMLGACATQTPRKQHTLRVAALFAGRLNDGGFVEAGYRGLLAARDKLGVEIAVRDGVQPEAAPLTAALRTLAESNPDLIIAHGGQGAAAAQLVAAEHPRSAFVVTQSAVTGSNLASYEVLQEQSAFLAGALAAWTTQSGVVGHMSGIRVTPGLKGRAAYAHGVAYANPSVKLLTSFSGNQDDSALSKKIALALIDARADVIFTMLNAGRSGAIEACRERGIWQIGNVGDWVARDPQVFIGSAFADVGLAVYNAIADASAGTWTPGTVKHIGLEDDAAVRLVVAPQVAADAKARLAQLSDDIRARRVEVPTGWEGAEFSSPLQAARG